MTTHAWLGALSLGAVLAATGCGKAVETPAPQVTPAATSTSSPPATAITPLPAPVVPKSAEAPSPAPGQAGDTSNPAFKDGGKVDPHK